MDRVTARGLVIFYPAVKAVQSCGIMLRHAPSPRSAPSLRCMHACLLADARLAPASRGIAEAEDASGEPSIVLETFGHSACKRKPQAAEDVLYACVVAMCAQPFLTLSGRDDLKMA